MHAPWLLRTPLDMLHSQPSFCNTHSTCATKCTSHPHRHAASAPCTTRRAGAMWRAWLMRSRQPAQPWRQPRRSQTAACSPTPPHPTQPPTDTHSPHHCLSAPPQHQPRPEPASPAARCPRCACCLTCSLQPHSLTAYSPSHCLSFTASTSAAAATSWLALYLARQLSGTPSRPHSAPRHAPAKLDRLAQQPPALSAMRMPST